MAVPEPQKNVRGELVVLQNSSFSFSSTCAKNILGDQASLETGLDENDASIANIVRLLKFIPGKTFYEIGCKSLIMICSFKSEHVVQIAIILINSQACWDNRVCCNQYEHQLKCSEREIYQSHQYQQNPQEHGQQTISCSVESSLPGWTTLSRLFPTKLMRAGL